MIELRTAIGTYPHTRPLKSGQVASPSLRLAFEEIAPISRAFAPMVREARFDISEMALATFLQAKAYGKPLVLLPVTLAARFQEAALLCRAASDIAGPADLIGRRVGVRAYSQTTGMWLRGILSDDYGVRPEQLRWVTFEDAHVAEYRDPAWVERARPGQELLTMLEQGELDAVIVGNDAQDDQTLRPVFADVPGAGQAFWNRHHFVPVNHLVVVRQELAIRHPDMLGELVRMFREAATAGVPVEQARLLPTGRAALDPAVMLALRYATEQGLLPRPFGLEDAWEGLPSVIALQA